MANDTHSQNAGGRPRHYTSEQVADIVAGMTSGGIAIDKIDAKAVQACCLHQAAAHPPYPDLA